MKVRTAVFWGASLLLAWLLIIPSASAQGPDVPTIVDLGSRRELFVDRFLIDRLENTTLKLHHPVSGGVAIKLDKPWEGPANAGIAVFRRAGRLLMYYRAMTVNQGDRRHPFADRAEPTPVSHLVSCHLARTDVVHDQVPVHHALSPDCKQPNNQLSLDFPRGPGNKTRASCVFYLTEVQVFANLLPNESS